MIASLGVFVLAASTFATPSTLSAPVLCSDAPAPVERANFASGVTVKAMCTADCGPFTDVSCSGNVCNAANRSCPGEQGHVTCDGTTYYCPACSAECTEGQFKIVFGSTCGCPDGLSTERDRYQCIGGQWVFQSTSCGAPFCHDF